MLPGLLEPPSPALDLGAVFILASAAAAAAALALAAAVAAALLLAAEWPGQRSDIHIPVLSCIDATRCSGQNLCRLM